MSSTCRHHLTRGKRFTSLPREAAIKSQSSVVAKAEPAAIPLAGKQTGVTHFRNTIRRGQEYMDSPQARTSQG